VPSEWPVAAPEEVGMDSNALAELLESIQAQGDAIDSVLVARDGRLVLDAYFDPFRAGLRHELRSCTKSVTSMLVGIAIGERFIPGVERPVVGFFPGRTIANLDGRKRAMRLENLLTMTTGLDWEEDIPYWAPQNSFSRMVGSPDPVQFFLDTPMSVDPGTRFSYNTGSSHLLSAILQQATGERAFDFARSRLFAPLGISDVSWAADVRGVNFGGTLLQMRPRDLARLGELYRRGGAWEGRRLVPRAWIRDSTRPRVMATESLGYGYQWWLPPSGGYDARGYGGQLLWVLPKQRLVIVMTGGTQDTWLPGTLAGLFILPAVKGDGPLPENPAARARLAAAVRAAGEPQPRPVPPLPEIAREVAGRTYMVEANGAGWTSVALDFRDAEAAIEIHRGDAGVKLPVGLDNVFRITELPGVGTAAERGAWVDGRTFQLSERFVGDSTRSEIRFAFAGAAGDEVEVTVRRLDSGYVETFRGSAQVRRSAVSGSSCEARCAGR
jgi:CubicO group peptidase (beta-lactamase class C family)